MTPQQRDDNFRLTAQQFKQAFELASQAAAGDFTEYKRPYLTVAHLLGICAYCHELLADLKMEMENSDD